MNSPSSAAFAQSRTSDRLCPLPCPFCGDTDVAVVEGSTFRWRQVECNNCGARCGETRVRTIPPIDAEENERFAIEEWNKRANVEVRRGPATEGETK